MPPEAVATFELGVQVSVPPLGLVPIASVIEALPGFVTRSPEESSMATTGCGAKAVPPVEFPGAS